MTQIAPDLPPLAHRPGLSRHAGASLAVLLAVGGVLLMDPISEFHLIERPLLWLGDKLKLDGFFNLTQEFGSYTILIVLVWSICVIQPRRRAYLGSLLIALILSGLVVGILKEGFGRARPDYSVVVDETNHRSKERQMIEIADKYPELGIIRKETGGVPNQGIWLLWNRPSELVGLNWFSSFPSGHSNQAFLLAVFLTAFFGGKGRVLWYILAVGCALARVRFERHFPTDILLGGAIGYLTAHHVLSWQWPVRLGAKIFRVPMNQ